MKICVEQVGDIYGTSDTCCRIPANHHFKHLMHKLHCTHLIYCTNREKVLKMYFLQYFGHIVQNLHKLYKICTNCTKCAHTKICWTSYWTKTKMTTQDIYICSEEAVILKKWVLTDIWRLTNLEEMLFDRHLKSCFWQIWKRCFLTNMTAMLCSLSVFSVSISTCQEWKLLQFFWPLEIFEEEADNWSTFYRVRTFNFAVWVSPSSSFPFLWCTMQPSCQNSKLRTGSSKLDLEKLNFWWSWARSEMIPVDDPHLDK